jgi:addiction module HigA family antidote
MENKMPPIHPGEILKEELIELGLSANAFAKALGVPTNRITMILKGQRGISADTALRLSRYFGMSPQFWMNLQQSYELKIIEETNGTEIKRAVKPRAA